MIRSFTALKILPQALAMFACINITAINAAVFPSLLDQSGSSAGSLPGPSVVVPEGSFVDWLALGDIDNDGVLDYKFQVYSLLGTERISSTNIACESVFIAASSFVDATFALSDATEIRGLTTDTTVLNSCNISSLSSLRLSDRSDQNNDGVEELYIVDRGVVYVKLERGTVIDLTNLVDSNIGPTIESQQYRHSVGDINGDGIADVALFDNGYAGPGPRAMIVSGASLGLNTHLSFDAVEEENILFVERYPSAFITLTGSSDFNGDSVGDVILTSDYGYYFLYGSEDIYVDDYSQLPSPNSATSSLCDTICGISQIGDFNADGFDDVIVKNFYYSSPDLDTSRIAYGSSEGLPLLLGTGNSTSLDFSGVNNDETEYFLNRTNGDFNDDGSVDLFFSARNNESIVVLGPALSKPEIIDVELLDGNNGFKLISANSVDSYGLTALDVNNDGVDDVFSTEDDKIILFGRSSNTESPMPLDTSFQLEGNGHSVYSQTSHELFWNRATHPSGILGYEVSLDSEVLTTIDATSFYVDNINDAGSFEYRVTAIAFDGSRSMYATFAVEHDVFADQSTVQPEPASFELRGEIYSSTAAEIFWDTVLDSQGNSVVYQVSRNGEVLVTSDARSYFDASRTPSGIYSYEVVSISESGFEIATSSLALTSQVQSGNEASPTNVQPINARGLVYSSSAIELFWDRSTEESISSYSIYRNGLQIGESSGTSFFDIGLNADTEYQYSIRATNLEGQFVGDEAIVVLQSGP